MKSWNLFSNSVLKHTFLEYFVYFHWFYTACKLSAALSFYLVIVFFIDVIYIWKPFNKVINGYYDFDFFLEILWFKMKTV